MLNFIKEFVFGLLFGKCHQKFSSKTGVAFTVHTLLTPNLHIPLPEAVFPGEHVDKEKDYLCSIDHTT